ncbi:MAG: hypothetical protein U1F98_16760 [Verrucomicrobiota bacterium]
MKTTTHACRLGAILLAATGFAASAIHVTYQVDMSVQIALGNFNPLTDTVFISGDFSSPGWQSSLTDGSTNYILHASSNPSIYTNTFSIVNAVGAWENHQFVINPGGAFGNLHWESSVGNRYFQVPATDLVLSTVYWNDVSSAGNVTATPVTFAVNMSVQTTLGNFNPDTDLVLVAGDFNWDANSAPTLTNNGANVWSTTLMITNTVGSTNNYKFLFVPFVGSTTWENDGVGDGGARNRGFVLTTTATNLGVVYFNNVTNANSLIVKPVTFTVDMTVEDALGNFTPGLDTVTVAGDVSLNNWDASASTLSQDITYPDLYHGTFNVTNMVGTTVNYKFVVDAGAGALGWEANNVGPNGGQNRQFAMPNAASNLPSVYFNNINDIGSISISNSPGFVTLRWTPGTRIRLQSASSLSGAWTDVPNTLGSNNATLGVSGQSYFRSKGP